MRLFLLISSLLTLDGVLADVTSAFISAATANGVGATLNLGGTIATTEAGVAASTSTSIVDPAITTAPAGDLSTVTIDGLPGYQVAANCVKNCLFEEFEGTPDGLYLPIAIGCARYSRILFALIFLPPNSIPIPRSTLKQRTQKLIGEKSLLQRLLLHPSSSKRSIILHVGMRQVSLLGY
jgi:hypothetical protein